MSTSQAPPLVVDLDGALLRSDLLVETGLAFLKEKPGRFWQPAAWLLHGKARLKEGLATAVDVDVAALPFDEDVIGFIEAERGRGRRIVLATASHRSLAESVAAHLGLFDEVMASASGVNLSAQDKRDALVRRFGEKGFDYVGDSSDDLPVWAAARHAHVVNPGLGVERRARQQANVQTVLRTRKPALPQWINALRFHQWLKNLLVLAPLLAAHRIAELPLLADAALAFVFFCLCASSVYLLNDILDLGDDRGHPGKRHRPFASGQLPITAGALLVPVLLAIAFAGACWLLPPRFVLVLASYYGLSLLYSLLLKRYMVIDVIALAMLYTLRIIAGAAACGIMLSFWMLGFSMFMFLSLALVKRYAELHQAKARGSDAKTPGRGYYPSDLEMIAAMGAASGYMAVLVLAFYINGLNAAALYARPQVIWLACPLLLFWVGRTWMLAHRGLMHDDPVVFAVRDRASLVVGALFGLVFWGAT